MNRITEMIEIIPGLLVGSIGDVELMLHEGVDVLVPLAFLNGNIWAAGFRGEILYYPIDDMGVLPDDVLRVLVDSICSRLDEGRRVGLFCGAGHGRTGYVAACVLARRGIKDPIGYLRTKYSSKETLRKAAELEPEHLSFYSLQIEEGTPLYRMFRNDEIEQLPDEADREMYHEAVRFLEDNDYRLYEISNAARRGRECRHNLKYWTMAPYFGIGAGAHSFLNGIRYASPEGIDDYIILVEDLAAEGVYFEKRGNVLCRNTLEDSMSDHMFTGLRLREGVDLREFARRYQVDPEEKYRDAIQKHLMDGTMVMEQGRLKFTEKGIDLSSYILIDFI